MHNPLEQFAIKDYIKLHVHNVDLSFTNASLMMLLVVCVVSLWWYLITRRDGYRVLNTDRLVKNGVDLDSDGDMMTKESLRCAMVPCYAAMISEYVYELVVGMTRGGAGPRSEKFVPFIFSVYVFVLLCNLLGMIPGGYAVTSSIAITFALSAMSITIFTIIGFIKHGWGYWRVLIPSGTPTFIAPLIFVIELFAYLVRPVSLALRLSANMMAGHILLKVVASLIIITGIAGFLPFVFLTLMTAFEMFIAILQAYVFSMLSCVYLSDVLELH